MAKKLAQTVHVVISCIFFINQFIQTPSNQTKTALLYCIDRFTPRTGVVNVKSRILSGYNHNHCVGGAVATVNI